MVHNHDPTSSPLPSRQRLQDWLHALDEQVASGECSVEELVVLLGETRRFSRDLGWVADYLAVRAREAGASYPDLAAVWSTRGSRSLVNGPRSRLHRLIDKFGGAEQLLAAIDRLDLDDDHDAPGQS